MKINSQPDCGNAPKRELVKDLTVYFASYDLDKVMEYMDDQVTWTLVGDDPVVGKEQFRAELEKMSGNKVQELTIHSVITHGKEAAVNGEMRMQDGQVYEFSDFYEFTSAAAKKAKSIRSYVVLKK